MNNKWYRHLNIVAAILIGAGGIGINTTDTLPAKYYYGAALAAGVGVFVLFLILRMMERRESNRYR